MNHKTHAVSMMPYPLKSRTQTHLQQSVVLFAIISMLSLMACQSATSNQKSSNQSINSGSNNTIPTRLRSVNENGDIFHDSFIMASRHYSNKDTGMQLLLPDKWLMYPYYNSMPAPLRQAALKMRESDRVEGMNGEMVFAARTQNMLLWLRVITEEAHMSLDEYFQIVKIANFKDLDQARISPAKTTRIGGLDGLVWEYIIPMNGRDIRFIEYQVKHGSFNSRITFWGLNSVIDLQQAHWERFISNLNFE